MYSVQIITLSSSAFAKSSLDLIRTPLKRVEIRHGVQRQNEISVHSVTIFKLSSPGRTANRVFRWTVVGFESSDA